jgi:protein-disulfide isomerase
MHVWWKTLLFSLAVAAGVHVSAGAARADEAALTARKAKIRANLELQYPQLAEIPLEMGDIAPSKLPGMDEGSFTMNGERVQRFLVTTDDKTLYLISAGPMNASLSAEEIKVALAERAKEEARRAAERSQTLAKASANGPSRGNAAAAVTIVEFSDFQCPYCARAAATMDQVLAKHGTDVKFVFKHFPLNFHPWAKPAAIAANCAAKQKPEAFWRLHDGYFKHQRELTPENVLTQSKTYLEGSGIDLAAWSTCAEDTASEAHKAAVATVDADVALAEGLGVQGTPSFFVNGRPLDGAQEATAFDAAIAEARKTP